MKSNSRTMVQTHAFPTSHCQTLRCRIVRFPLSVFVRIQRGLTLVELLVALTLSLFLIGGVLITYTSGRAAGLETERLSRMQENLRFASDFIVRDVRNAGFRDQLTLTFEQFVAIGASYAAIEGDELTIQYAGRGACGRQFDDSGNNLIIRNTYAVRNGNLVCDGEEVSDSGSVAAAEALIAGVTSISFQFIRPDGSTVTSNTCDFSTEVALEDACIGVEIELTFDDDPPRTVELQAAFRNVIVDQIYGR